MHALIRGGRFHCLSYSAHFLKGREIEANAIGAFYRAELILFRSPPSVIPSAQTITKGNKKENMPVVQDMRRYGCRGHERVPMCVLLEEAKPIEGEIQEAENVSKCLASREKNESRLKSETIILLFRIQFGVY